MWNLTEPVSGCVCMTEKNVFLSWGGFSGEVTVTGPWIADQSTFPRHMIPTRKYQRPAPMSREHPGALGITKNRMVSVNSESLAICMLMASVSPIMVHVRASLLLIQSARIAWTLIYPNCRGRDHGILRDPLLLLLLLLRLRLRGLGNPKPSSSPPQPCKSRPPHPPSKSSGPGFPEYQ